MRQTLHRCIIAAHQKISTHHPPLRQGNRHENATYPPQKTFEQILLQIQSNAYAKPNPFSTTAYQETNFVMKHHSPNPHEPNYHHAHQQQCSTYPQDSHARQYSYTIHELKKESLEHNYRQDYSNYLSLFSSAHEIQVLVKKHPPVRRYSVIQQGKRVHPV